MKNALFAVGAIVLAASAVPACAAPPQCWQNGAPVPCAAPPAAGNLPQQPAYYPPQPKYPPSWYYNPYNEPWFHCKIECGQ